MCIPTYSGEEEVLNDGIWLHEAFVELEPNCTNAVFKDDEAEAWEQDAPDCDLEQDGPDASYISAEEDVDVKDCFRDNRTPTLLDDDDEDVFVVVEVDDPLAIADDEDDGDDDDVVMAAWFCIKLAFNCEEDDDEAAAFWSIGSIMFP